MLPFILVFVLLVGLAVFIRGYRQYNNPDILNIPMVSPLGKQVFGGAAVIAAVVVFILSFRNQDAASSSSRRGR